MKRSLLGEDCPECEANGVAVRLRWAHGVDTQVAPGCPIWRLDWWRCPECREKFVTQQGENPEVAIGIGVVR